MPHTLVFFKGTFILLHMTEITQSVLVQTLPLVGSGPHQPANLVWLSIIGHLNVLAELSRSRPALHLPVSPAQSIAALFHTG